MKKSHPTTSSNVEKLRQKFEQQNLGASSTEDLYAKVNKPPKRGGLHTPSPEEIEAAHKSKPILEKKSSFADFTTEGNDAHDPLQLRDPTYDIPKSRVREYGTPSHPSETIYAPQRPLGNPYDRLGGRPSDGRRTDKLVNPYAVTDLEAGGWQASLYDTVGGGAQGRHSSSEPEHVYAELDFGENGGRSPQRPLESIYATVGMGAEGGQDSQQQENPIYQGVGRGTTTPPRTAKDVVTTKLLQNIGFQYGVSEIQVRCKTVYNNQHALNEQLAKILDDPQNAEQILQDLAKNPESPAKLAGRQALGIKSPARREAEDEFTHLCSALERHIHNTQKLHKKFTREQERERSQKHDSPERDPEHRHHHHRRHHARGREHDSPEHSPQRQRHGEKGMAYAM
ncbi:BID domain-containing T4SS effector [Bartonella grahamii]|uniref:BID domain-containing T4SS effector n=1 Tax=Bartonella grahamii TaxID=33045 RepID=UPI002E7B7C21|nr:BID domain-containing T4SS effector [Bartonella grahamii]